MILIWLSKTYRETTIILLEVILQNPQYSTFLDTTMNSKNGIFSFPNHLILTWFYTDYYLVGYQFGAVPENSRKRYRHIMDEKSGLKVLKFGKQLIKFILKVIFHVYY